MIKNLMVALILVCLLSGVGNAAHAQFTAVNDGYGTFSHVTNPNDYFQFRPNDGLSVNINWYYTVTHISSGTYSASAQVQYQNVSDTGLLGLHCTAYMGDSHIGDTASGTKTVLGDYTTVSTLKCSYPNAGCGAGWTGSGNISWVMVVAPSGDGKNTISGTYDCLTYVELYAQDQNDVWQLIDDDTDVTSYSFDILNMSTYKLVFSDSHEYEFTCNGTDITYDFDACSHTQYRFEESCGNLIPDSEGYYCENWAAGGGICYNFYTSNGILDISNTSAASIEVYTDTFIGETGWIIDPVVSNTTYTLENPNIAWGLKVIVQNESDGELIDGAMVKVDQDCYCTDGYSTRQKLTVNGMSQFGEMSLQDASLFVMKTGYKILDENTTGYSAFLSGRSNFSSKTWIVKLANTSSNNSSTFYEVNNTVDIHFVDITGNRTSKILDTDASVYLYYENNNTEEEAMTLKFQSSSTHTYFIDEQSWTIPYDAIGHKTIANSYFTPWDYSYRAVIYNSSIYGWNITIPLTVRNGTREEEQHYQNLTTNLWFRYAKDGKVDYRDDMKVAIHARSNNTTLMTTDIELWKDGVYIACKNLTATDYVSADFPYYYVWNPVFDYISGSNYSVRMYGFDRTLLETDYVVCVTDDTTRKNKLTIIVKDRVGGNLNNAYIYLEDWGSLPTGSTYYNAYEGIDNGVYRYKATKSGYSGGGWDEVTLNDGDKIVTYVLTEDYTNTSSTAQKFSDEDIKGFFFPLMFFLLTCIVLGGLKYVTQ